MFILNVSTPNQNNLTAKDAKGAKGISFGTIQVVALIQTKPRCYQVPLCSGTTTP
jgi:hypothetical protein